ncbi:MAG: hypothetical protein IAE65_07995 [Ignavibacteria bacterium]|nr:hypothetical protein [Ignavibacteria bacterium]
MPLIFTNFIIANFNPSQTMFHIPEKSKNMKNLKIKIGERVLNSLKIGKNENFEVVLEINEDENSDKIVIIGSKFGFGIFQNSEKLKSKDYDQLKLF